MLLPFTEQLLPTSWTLAGKKKDTATAVQRQQTVLKHVKIKMNNVGTFCCQELKKIPLERFVVNMRLGLTF